MESKRYFRGSDRGAMWFIVARDMQQVFEVMSKLDVTDAKDFTISEISAEWAAQKGTDDDENLGRDRLSKWPLGTALCSEY